MTVPIKDLDGNPADPFGPADVDNDTAVGDGVWKVDHYDHEFVPVISGDPDIDVGGTLLQTFAPDSLQFTLQLGKLGPGSASYELGLKAVDEVADAGITPEFVGAYRTDFLIRRDDIKLMAGMHTAAPSMQDSDTPLDKIQIAGQDWLHYLDRRVWPYDPDLSYVDWPDGFRFAVAAGEIGQIIKDVLETIRDVSPNWPGPPDGYGVSGHPSYSLGYTVACDDTGTTINYEISPMDTTTILQMITGLAENARGNGGFDFLMTWDKIFRLIYPEIGDPDTPVFTLEVDGTTHKANMLAAGMTNNGPAGTHFLGVGAGSSGQAGGVNRHFRANSAVYRRLDTVQEFGDVKNLALLEDLTGSSLSTGANPVLEIPITVDPRMIDGFWNLCRPGRYVQVNYDLRAHALSTAQKVVSMDVSVDQEGNERVDIGFTRGDQADPDAGLADF